MQLFRLCDSVCADGCPYYQAPAVDIEPRVHQCKLNYNFDKDLGKLLEACPLPTLEQVLQDYEQSNKNIYDFCKEELM